MAKTKYATAQDNAAISRILRTMKPKLDGTDLWGAAKEAISYLVVNESWATAEMVARDFMAGRPAFVDDRIGGQAAQSDWSYRVTKGAMFKAVKALNTASRSGLRGADCAGGSCAAAFRGGMRGLSASLPDIVSADRVQWSLLTTAQIRKVMTEAGQYGDFVLVKKARAALARRGVR